MWSSRGFETNKKKAALRRPFGTNCRNRELVSSSATANTGSAAYDLDSVAFGFESGNFAGAESRILRCSLSFREARVLNMSRPRPEGGDGIQIRGGWAGSDRKRGRDEFDHSGVQSAAYAG